MTSKANDIQHGGDHYKGSDFQHWDWVNACRLGYLVGTASKYVFRWRKKNGLEDINKGIHYLTKAIELGAAGSVETKRYDYFWRFAKSNDVNLRDAAILFHIMDGRLEEARKHLLTLRDEYYGEAEPDSPSES